MSQSPQSNSNKICIELSERSLDLYKAYAQPKSESESVRPRSQAILLKDDSFSSIDANAAASSKVTNTSVFRPPDWKQFGTPHYARFFDLDEQLNTSPFKYLNENNLSVYLNFLNVGYGGAKQPNEPSIKLYKEFCK